MIVHVTVVGKVQGVCFRNFVEINAQKLKLNGWVMNMPNGNVEAVFSGTSEKVKKIIELCKKGPSLARVENVSVNKTSDEEELTGFRIKY